VRREFHPRDPGAEPPLKIDSVHFRVTEHFR